MLHVGWIIFSFTVHEIWMKNKDVVTSHVPHLMSARVFLVLLLYRVESAQRSSLLGLELGVWLYAWSLD